MEIDHSHCFGDTVLSYGCGCNKGRVAGVSAAPGPQRVTVYQVQVNNQVVEEFATLPEARTKAVELGGRVKVTSKQTN